MAADLRGAMEVFARAREYVGRVGLQAEVEWQRSVELESFTESDLLREAAWVILCSGFREQVVRRVFDHVSLCYCDWESASAIVDAGPACRIAAMASFRNEAKLNAILKIAHQVHDVGFETVKRAIGSDPIKELSRFPHIGPVTVWHLAKNLGLDVAKPDRHLVRLSNHLGFNSATHFCTAVSELVGEQAKVIDLIIWRYLADNPKSREAWAPLAPNASRSIMKLCQIT